MQFHEEVLDRIESNGKNNKLRDITHEFVQEAIKSQYAYNFSCLGRPIIQFPQDIVAIQELIWQTKPDLIIETGIAHGGSLIMSASMLALLEYCDAVESGQLLDPKKPKRKVLGIDIDIRAHNLKAIQEHPMANRIEMIEGSSISADVVEKVNVISKEFSRILVFLDSNHTREHVLAELEAYAPLTSLGSYCVVFDTIIEDLSVEYFPDRPHL